MTFTVLQLPRAEADVDAILAWFVQRQAVDGARSWLNAYEQALAGLTRFPRRHSLAPENKDTTYEVRQFLFSTRHGLTYRGVFTIVGDEVRVLRVRGPGQAAVDPGEVSSDA